MKKIAIIIIILTGCYSFAAGQSASSSATQNLGLTLNDAISISFASGSSANYTANFASAKDLKSGIDCPDQSLVVKSTRSFKVDVASSATNFTYSGSAITGNILPVTGSLKIHVTANNTGGTSTHGNTLVDLSVTALNLLNNCTAGGNQTFTVKLKMTPGVSIASGSYALNLVYTATQL